MTVIKTTTALVISSLSCHVNHAFVPTKGSIVKNFDVTNFLPVSSSPLFHKKHYSHHHHHQPFILFASSSSSSKRTGTTGKSAKSSNGRKKSKSNSYPVQKYNLKDEVWGYSNEENYNYDMVDDDDDDPFGDYNDQYLNNPSVVVDDDYDSDNANRNRNSNNYNDDEYGNQGSNYVSSSKHFFSKKSIHDPNFSIVNSLTFQQLCRGASITQPSRIQALSWPTLLTGQNCIVADQTGSGKTLSYLIPLLQRMIDDKQNHNTNNDDDDNDDKTNKRGNGSPKILILAPTAELADQIKVVCDKTTSHLNDAVVTRVITATGSHSTNIRDQIRMLANQHVDVLISTPGRIATILRTKNTSLNLTFLQSIVLDEVDVLLIDETFGPQLRTIGAAAPVSKAQFVFVTATLPDEIVETVRREFENVQVIQGPGLHRIAPNLKEHLVDVSVPATSNRDLDLCFEYKARELMKALRANRCKRTLVFCNTVESCRKVENLIKRNDRRSSLFIVGAYHNAMTPERRRKNLNIFVNGLKEKGNTDQILICTDRAARGVDFDSAPVDHVIIFDFPKDPAEYVRRVGRTARAGRVGSSTVFAFAWQLPIARKIMGSKLESFSIASDSADDGDDDEEFTQKQRRQRRKSSIDKDKMIRGNIKQGKLWK